MGKKINRRDFLKHSAAITGVIASGLGFPLYSREAKQAPDIVVASGKSPAKLTGSAIEALGGMQRFVSKGDKVILLPNPQGRQVGTSTSPEMVAETVKLCLAAGAGSVAVSSLHGPSRWRSTRIIEAVEKAGGKMIYPDSEKDWIELKVPDGKILKSVKIIRNAIENDVLIDMPIAKQHDSTRMTCNLKNLMGFNSNNSDFHQGESHLQQCIVDLASIIHPSLSIVDANTILIENGPFGPGKVASPQKVFVGTDMVAVDALCCGLIDLNPHEVGHIKGAHQIGLGQIDVTKLKIKEIQA